MGCVTTVKNKLKELMYESLVEPVLVKREKNYKLVYGLFALFTMLSAGILVFYYFLYIHGQLVRVDVDYSDRSGYLEKNQTLTCDCALPILLNPKGIIGDPNFLQPKFKQCLTRNLTGIYPEEIVDSTVAVLMYNFLALPLNSNIHRDGQTFQNLLVSSNGDILQKIGYRAQLRYAAEIQQAFLNYMAIYTTNLLESTSLAKQIDPSINPPNRESDTIEDILRDIRVNDDHHRALTAILQCYFVLETENIDPEAFIGDLSEDDCLPVNCHLFAGYTFWQSVVLLITFYLAVIGYFMCGLQCIYQKFTDSEIDDSAHDGGAQQQQQQDAEDEEEGDEMGELQV